jgi:hypothetical protein
MGIPTDVKGLTLLFERLGARDSARWARSQVEEGIPQLARYLFLRQAWQKVVAEGDSGWIDRAIGEATREPDRPYAGAGHALGRLRAKGATDADLTDLVRAMQASFLFDLCCVLDEPGLEQAPTPEVTWALVQTDSDGNVVGAIDGLHESVLETDPTGREMRPRAAAG